MLVKSENTYYFEFFKTLPTLFKSFFLKFSINIALFKKKHTSNDILVQINNIYEIVINYADFIYSFFIDAFYSINFY